MLYPLSYGGSLTQKGYQPGPCSRHGSWHERRTRGNTLGGHSKSG